MLFHLKKIVSGGQTGVDRAALDFAMAKGIPHGGWCPLARWAEDGPIASLYHLTETPSADPQQRTEWNVRDSDGTVILSIAAELTGGSRKTAEFARQHQKPCLHLAREREGKGASEKLFGFLAEHSIRTLNVAGPRQTTEPDAAGFAREVLERCFEAFWAGGAQPEPFV